MNKKHHPMVIPDDFDTRWSYNGTAGQTWGEWFLDNGMTVAISLQDDNLGNEGEHYWYFDDLQFGKIQTCIFYFWGTDEEAVLFKLRFL